MNLPRKGVKKLAVVCPSFYCDDLETLDEISNHGKEVFMRAGGESYRTIPCPNHSESSLHCMEELIHQADHWPLAEV